MTLAHGGNVYEVACRLGCSPDALLDYSASINPFGPPEGLMEEFDKYFHRLQHYPDIANRSLLDDLARHHDVPVKRIVAGNGSTELIYWLPRALGIREAVVTLPTFSEYRKAFELQGVRMHKLMTRSENLFQPTVEDLENACKEFSPQAILFTHPGSPSGALLSPSVREWLIEKSRNDDLYCIVDEVFVDFCEGESLKEFLNESPRLALIRSMTKFYGVPGLRLGYLLASEGVAEAVKRLLPPWSVNTMAQIAGSYCLRQGAYRQKTLDVVKRERDSLAKKLEETGRCRVFPGEANYLLMELAEDLPPARTMQRELVISDRILVRDCSSFEGLGDRYVRVAVRLPEQNERLLDSIVRWMDDHS